VASGNLDEQADEIVEGQLEGILLGSMFLEKLFQSLRIEERFHDATDHDTEGHRLAMRQHLNRNQLEAWLTKKCLELVETLSAASMGAGIGVGTGTGAST
jgi:hypothetical protein